MKKLFFLILTVAAGFSPNLFAQMEETFSAKGKVIQLDTVQKTLKMRTEAGLEFNFRTNEATQIRVGEEAKPLDQLAVDDSVEIEYVYNEDYEKVARSIRKSLS